MDLIISEKAIAGENIAQLLADGDVKHKTVSGAKVFEFNWKGKEIQLVPLRGHISDVEYPKKPDPKTCRYCEHAQNSEVCDKNGRKFKVRS